MNRDQRAERRRWRGARLLNRLPSMCWSDLVGWVLFQDAPEHRRLRDCRIGASCRDDATRNGCCYCGKIGDQSPGQHPELYGGRPRLRVRVASWWLRVTSRHFCFRCDRHTITWHTWCLAAFERELADEWRSR